MSSILKRKSLRAPEPRSERSGGQSAEARRARRRPSRVRDERGCRSRASRVMLTTPSTPSRARSPPRLARPARANRRTAAPTQNRRTLYPQKPRSQSLPTASLLPAQAAWRELDQIQMTAASGSAVPGLYRGLLSASKSTWVRVLIPALRPVRGRFQDAHSGTLCEHRRLLSVCSIPKGCGSQQPRRPA